MDCCRNGNKASKSKRAVLSVENMGHSCLSGPFAGMTQQKKSACKGLEHLGVHADVCLAMCLCLLVVPRSSQWEGMAEGDGSCCCVGDSWCICQWGMWGSVTFRGDRWDVHVKGQALRVDMELFQGREVSARRNIHSYVPGCITSLMSIGEGESSAGRLKGDYTSPGTKKTLP